MKKLLLSLALLSIAGAAFAQSSSDVSFSRQGAVDLVSFVVPREANIRYYLLEGSRDSLSFHILSRVDARGNTVLPQSYTTTHHDTSYRYYRIRQVDMGATYVYSVCIAVKKPVAPILTPPAEQPAMTTTAAAPCTAISAVCGR